jgi:acetolactate synthase-1/2/3 large subunit
MSTVADEIVNVVQRWGVRHVFCVPGESYLATLQAAGTRPGITLVSTRHEEGAGLMAEAWAKASGLPGVCLVTRGPGLTHLAIALHTAHQDSTPMVVIVGQVPSAVKYREGFQELDVAQFVRPMAKWAAELDQPDRVSELVERAFEIATTGRPGPVVLSLPENIDRAEAPAATPGPRHAYPPGAHPAAIEAAAQMLSSYPDACVIAGAGVNTPSAREQLIRFAEAGGFGVYAGWRRFDVFPNDHELYLGPLPSLPVQLYQPLRDAETVIAVGTRLGEFSTLGYACRGRISGSSTSTSSRVPSTPVSAPPIRWCFPPIPPSPCASYPTASSRAPPRVAWATPRRAGPNSGCATSVRPGQSGARSCSLTRPWCCATWCRSPRGAPV